MNVFTYYEPIFEGHGELLSLWAKSWRANGWTPVIIGESQFQLHPFASEYESRVSKLPTINDVRYEMACFRRWLAMATIGGLFTDYDLVNQSFEPYGNEMDLVHAKGDQLRILCKDMVPCAVYGGMSQYEHACKVFSEYQPDSEDRFRKSSNLLVEDMTILRRFHPSDWFCEIPICCEFGKPGWENHSLVHCSSASLDGKRAWKMKELCP